MNRRNKTVVRWPLVILYAGMMTALTACGVTEGTTTATPAAFPTPVPTETTPLRLEDGAVEVQDKNHVWVPIAGETTFDLIGKLESDNPWMVTGNTFAVRDSTKVAEGAKVGDLVEVKGVILEDATWLAGSIELAKEQIYPTILLTGKVDAMDPWVVSGMMIHATYGTKVTGKIVPGSIVRVKILLLKEGSWDIATLTPLSNFTDIPGCATVAALVLRASRDEVQFADWPALPLGQEVKVENEAGSPAALSANHSVLVVVCPGENGQVMVTKIVILRNSPSTSREHEPVS